jgi:hypothetical protein
MGVQQWVEQSPDAGQQVLQSKAGIGPDITCTASLRLGLLAGIRCRMCCQPLESALPRLGAERRPAS